MTTLDQKSKAAAERMLTFFLDDDELVELAAHKLVSQRIASGELIEASKLAVGPGLVLEPRGLVAGLKEAIDAVLDLFDQRKQNPKWADEAEAILMATIPNHEVAGGAPDEAEPEPAEPPAAPSKKAPAKKAAAKKAAEEPKPARRRRSAPVDPTVRRRPDRRPEGYPTGQDEYPCEVCQEPVAQGAAEISFARCKEKDTGRGMILCVDDLKVAIGKA